MPAAPPPPEIAQHSDPWGLSGLLQAVHDYGAVAVVAVAAILALWRVSLRLEKAWALIKTLGDQHAEELKDEMEKRVAAFREVQSVADAVNKTMQGVTMITEHRTEMTASIADAQNEMTKSINRMTDTLANMVRQNEDAARDLNQLLVRSEACRDGLRDNATKMDEAARKIDEILARRTAR